MGLIKQFLESRKTNKQTSLNLEEENKTLKNKIIELEDKIKEIEYLHAEEINAIDREFLTWYNQQNNALNSENSREIKETDRQTRPEQQPLDLEQKTDDLEIGDLIND